MERVVAVLGLTVAIPVLFALGLAGPAAAQDDLGVVPGVITASNVDVTADDGSLLAERLGVGDMVYIVLKPKSERKGWVRITRSPDDAMGIGWVEAKNIQRFVEYRSTGAQSPKPAAGSSASEPSSDVKTGRIRIAVLPFVTAESRNNVARDLYRGFSAALKARKQFEIVSNVPSQGVNVESPEGVARLLATHQLDGIFVGKLSNAIGGSRLLQMKFVGKEGGSFAFEKIKRIPVAKDPQNALKELAEACAAEFPTP
jgi:hypothetical protein